MESKEAALELQHECTRACWKPSSCTFRNKLLQTASEYLQELAKQHFLHLRYQRNNVTTDEHDCRKKYVPRSLFRKIAREIPPEQGPFHQSCDGLRLGNVFVSNLAVTDFVDGNSHTLLRLSLHILRRGSSWRKGLRLGNQISMTSSSVTDRVFKYSSLPGWLSHWKPPSRY
jgi:hypothetical protein